MRRPLESQPGSGLPDAKTHRVLVAHDTFGARMLLLAHDCCFERWPIANDSSIALGA